MAQNSTNHSLDEDAIDLIEIIKFLKEHKKLIILTILFFTITSFIYSLSLKPSFITSVKLEIGYVEDANVDREFIEPPLNLISELKILVMKNPDDKFSQNVSMSLFEGRVIDLETTSSSAERNENLLNEIINYIDERHSNLFLLRTDQKKNLISNEIESTKARINYFKSKLSSQTQSQYFNLISNLDKETQAIERLNLVRQNSRNNDEVFTLSQKLAMLDDKLESLDSRAKATTQVIQNFKTKSIKPNSETIIFLGIVFGFFAGILLAVLYKLIKSYRDIEA